HSRQLSLVAAEQVGAGRTRPRSAHFGAKRPQSDILFLVAVRGPPRFTLFPYTTLFRSEVLDSGGRAFDVSHRLLVESLGDDAKRDRKSTRLNSSHVAISYAVFCLKKKKIHETQIPVIAGAGRGSRAAGAPSDPTLRLHI